MAPETLIAAVIAMHAFDPAEFEDETRLGFRGATGMNSSLGTVSGIGGYENVQSNDEP